MAHDFVIVVASCSSLPPCKLAVLTSFPPALCRTWVKSGSGRFGMPQLWLALLTFLYVDFLDCTGTLMAMARLIDDYHPGLTFSVPTPVGHFTSITNASPLRSNVA